MATGYIPSSSGWSGHNSLYTGYLRIQYSTTYNAATNTSSVTITPQFKSSAPLGNDYRFFIGGTTGSTPAIYVNGSIVYEFGGNYGSGNYLSCGDAYDSWVPLNWSYTFTVDHNASGDATFFAGIYCSALSMYWQSQTITFDQALINNIGSTGESVTIHENRSLNVSYNANGGSGAPSATYFYGSTESITLSSTQPTRTGYTFLGWATSSSATSATYSSGQNIGTRTSSLVLYAVWRLNAYTVSYDANGGTGAPSPQTKNHDVDLRLSSVRPTWANELIGNYRVTLDANGGSVSTASLSANVYRVRTFSSWNTWRSGGGTTYAPGSTYSMNANADMYAQWSVSQKVDSVVLPVPTRIGYSFKGWATDSSASSGITGNYTPPSSITLYAIWAINQYKLTISQGTGSTVTVVRDGTELTSGSTIYYGDSLTITIVANTGYSLGTHTVNGWSWTSGTHVVSGDVTVVSTANKRTFRLSATLSNSGVVVNMLRTSSPIGGATSGTVNDGTTLYYNDVVSVSCSVNSGFTIKTATVNGSPITFSSGVGRKTVTVTGNVVVVITTEIGAIVYIGNEPYQVFIGDGSNWNQYQAYIGNGSSWEAY